MENRRITLRTERGWSNIVALHDPMFSDVLAPIIDLQDESVSELLLTGSVAEAFEKEWGEIEKLMARYNLWKGPDRHYYYYPPDQTLDKTTILLSSVRHLSRILNLPSDWRMVVSVLSSDPDYREHIALQVPHYKSLNDGVCPMYVDFQLSTLYGAWGLDGFRKDPYIAAVIVNHHATKEKLGTMSDVDWQLASDLSPSRPDWQRIALGSLSGRGSYKDKFDWRNLVDNVMVRASDTKLSIAYNYPVAMMYEVGIRLFPEDVPPFEFGLEYLFGVIPKKRYISGPGRMGKLACENGLASVVIWVHLNMTLIAREKGENLLKTFLRYSSRFIVGKTGLARILLSLLHNMEPEYEEMASLIENRLEEKFPKLSEKFPEYKS